MVAWPSVPGRQGHKNFSCSSACSYVQATMQIQVECPPGAETGTLFQFQVPDGRILQATVPKGILPGQAFSVEVPETVPETQIVVGKPVSGQPAGAAQGTPVTPPVQ